MAKQEMYHQQPCFCLPCKVIKSLEQPQEEKKVKRAKKSVPKKQSTS